MKEDFKASVKKTFTVTGGGLLKAALFIFLSVCVSQYLFRGMLSEVPPDTPRSKEVAEALRVSLAARENIQLSALVKSAPANKTYAVVWAPYEYPFRFKCDLFPSGNLEPLQIKASNSETIFMLTSLDLSGIVDIAAITNRPLVFCDKQPLICIPLENAYLNVTATPKGTCYTLASK